MKTNKMMLLSLVSFLAASCVSSAAAATNGTALNKVEFKDIGTHWAKDQIDQAVAKGYVNGYEDGTFRPDNSVTRAEFVKMVDAALKISISGDTSGADWYKPYVNAAVQSGIHEYSDFTTGDWDTPMTRFEMARMADRAAGLTTTDSKKWMYLATQAGLIQGTDDTGTLAVDGTTTRAESVTIIERILDVKAGKKLQADKHAVNRAELLWHRTNIFTVMPEIVSDPKPFTPWDPKNLIINTEDGLWQGEVDYVMAIDMDDPNDPGLSELPKDVNTMYWYADGGVKHYVTEFPHSYLLYCKTHLNLNTDPKSHSPAVNVSIEGNAPNLNSKSALNDVQRVVTKREDSIVQLPKDLVTSGYFSIFANPMSGGETEKKTPLFTGSTQK